jgi:hypothetical protein
VLPYYLEFPELLECPELLELLIYLELLECLVFPEFQQKTHPKFHQI